MIPKVMNFFWGNDKLSWMRYLSLYSFKKLNPDWKVRFYCCPPSKITYKTWQDGVQQDFFMFKGPNYFSKVKDLDIEIVEKDMFEEKDKNLRQAMGPSHKSNFFKWEKMATEGGFYSDMDILYLRPIDEYYEEVKGMDTICCYHHTYFSIGFLGSSGNNQFFKDIYDFCFKRFSLKEYQSAGVQTMYTFLRKEMGVQNSEKNWNLDFWSFIKRKYNKLTFFNNSMSFVYPWKFDEMEHVFCKEHKEIPKDCVGIHWYAGDQTSQKFNNLLTSNNYRDYKNTFTYFLKQIL